MITKIKQIYEKLYMAAASRFDIYYNTHKVLRDIKFDIKCFKNNPNNGICETFYRHDHRIQNARSNRHQMLLFKLIMKTACIGWEHYSGDPMYPIKHPNKPDPCRSYIATAPYCFYTGEYGRRRLELLDRMIALMADKHNQIRC